MSALGAATAVLAVVAPSSAVQGRLGERLGVGDGGGVVDVVVVLLAVGYGLTGLRRGFVLGVFSLVGFLGGGALAAAFLPDLLVGWTPGWQRVALVLGGVLVAALLGQALMLVVGGAVRRLVSWGPVRAVDALLGALMSVLLVGALVWFAAGALRTGPSPAVSRAVEASRVVGVLEQAVPVDAQRVFDRLGTALEAGGFPRVFTDQGVEPIVPVEPADAGPEASAVAEAARPSIVKVTGVATACSRGVEGTGFVVSPERVVTNAHVVAGVDDPAVQVGGEGRTLDGEVVLYDPERDLAVLAVPGLTAPALPLGEDLSARDQAVVAGFPLDGPFAVEPARVRQVLDALGEDVYGTPGVTREVYSLLAQVQPGNSGGPLLSLGGDVVGVVFARSVDDPSTGYALTLDESRSVIDAAPAADQAVSTGDCAPV